MEELINALKTLQLISQINLEITFPENSELYDPDNPVYRGVIDLFGQAGDKIKSLLPQDQWMAFLQNYYVFKKQIDWKGIELKIDLELGNAFVSKQGVNPVTNFSLQTTTGNIFCTAINNEQDATFGLGFQNSYFLSNDKSVLQTNVYFDGQNQKSAEGGIGYGFVLSKDADQPKFVIYGSGTEQQDEIFQTIQEFQIPYCDSRLWNNLNADMLDGVHYTDITNEIANAENNAKAYTDQKIDELRLDIIEGTIGTGLVVDVFSLPEKTGVIIPMYFYPWDNTAGTWSTQFDDFALLLKKYHDVPKYVIINPENGPGTVEDAVWRRTIKRLHGSGAKVLGYVFSGYTNRPISDIKSDISQWKTLYPDIDGIFIDEMTNDNDANHRAYFAELTEYAHDLGLYPVIGNPGAGVYGSYFTENTADIICIWETSDIPTEQSLEEGNWEDSYREIPYNRKAIILHSQPTLDDAVLDLIRKHAGLIYITDSTLPNPWLQPSSYLEDLLHALETRNADMLDGKHYSDIANEITNVENNAKAYTDTQILNLKSGTLQINLNADLLDGKHASDFADAAHQHDDRYYTKMEIDGMVSGSNISLPSKTLVYFSKGLVDNINNIMPEGYIV